MSTNIVTQIDGELRVSSLDVAERTENQHKNVLELIRANLDDFAAFGEVAFETRPGYNNAQVQIAQLNEQQSILLLVYMRNSEIVKAFKLELVKQFYAMKQALATPAFTLPQSFSEALRELAASVETNAALEAKVEADSPKVDYVDTYVADGDLRLVRNVAKSIDMTEGELRADLLERKWIYAEHMTRWSDTKQEKETVTRYSAYSHKASYFYPQPNHTAPRFKGEVMHTLKVTPQGAVAIARLYGKHLQLVAAVAS